MQFFQEKMSNYWLGWYSKFRVDHARNSEVIQEKEQGAVFAAFSIHLIQA